MVDSEESIVFRRNIKPVDESEGAAKSSELYDKKDDHDDDDYASRKVKLTLMEELLLLGLKDREGYTSFWNDSISRGLRAAFLIELALRDRISLEAVGIRRFPLSSRKVIVKKDLPTGDMLLDEALKLIKSSESSNTKTWIEYLTGETWNPFKISLQMRNVRERLAKSLAEKGICTTEKQNFIVFDLTTHPLVDRDIKQRIINRIQEAVLTRWSSDPQKVERRILSLIILAHYSDVLENAFISLCDSDYDIAMKRVKTIISVNHDEEAAKQGACETVWSIYDALAS